MSDTDELRDADIIALEEIDKARRRIWLIIDQIGQACSRIRLIIDELQERSKDSGITTAYVLEPHDEPPPPRAA